MVAASRTARSVIVTYLTTTALFTLAASLIWGINTLFLMDAGLDIFHVMLVNTAFTVGQIIFEVPTGVVADTIGRKASLLLGCFTLFVSTLIYVAAARFGWGIWAFAGASVVLGLGFTFQTGAVDAWLVDALAFTGYEGARERVFAWGGMTFGVAMLVGTLGGGLLGQIDLALPYVVRAVLLLVTLAASAVMMRDLGFAPRPLTVASFGSETRDIFDAGVTYGWRNRVVRPLLFVSGAFGVFMLFGFYSWQRYALDLLGREFVWVAGVLAATSSLAGIGGNALVRRVMRDGERRRSPARVLAWSMAIITALAVGIAAVGLLVGKPGVVPLFLAAVLWAAWNVIFGVVGPVRQAYLNEQVPSAQRATVLSLDAFFADVGGAGGQPALGWLSRATSIPVGWLVGAIFLGLTVPGYTASGRALEQAELTRTGEPSGSDAAVRAASGHE